MDCTGYATFLSADAGKSTIGGQILYLTNMVDERTIQKYEREAKDKNRESWFVHLTEAILDSIILWNYVLSQSLSDSYCEICGLARHVLYYARTKSTCPGYLGRG